MLKTFKKAACTVLSLSIFLTSALSPFDNGFFAAPLVTEVSAETDGSLSYTLNSGSITITDCESTAKSVTVPSEIGGARVTKIADSAFEDCKSLTSVELPDGITEIGNYAFRNCTSLSSIVIPDSVTVMRYSVFFGCTSLSEVTLSSSLTALGNYTFFGCTSLTEIAVPASVRDIGAYALCGCTALQSVTLSEGLRTVGERAFADCISLRDIAFPNGTVKLGGWSFYGCTALSEVSFPDTVTDIGKNSFESCAGLTSIALPEALVTIGDSAFRGTSVSEITLPDSTTTVGAYAFYGCMSLRSFAGGTGLLNIGEYAFFGCSALSGVSLEEGVKVIGASAFRSCTALRDISLPSTVSALGEYAFCGCTNLAGAVLGSVEAINAYTFYGCSALASVPLPETVRSVGSYAFSGCAVLGSITLPDGVTTIGERAFQGCRSISEFIFPASLSSIGDYAFYGCVGLSEISVPAGTATVGNMAFYGCTGIKTAMFASQSAEYGNLIFYDCSALKTVYGFADSTIKSYAAKCALAFTALEFNSVEITSPAQKDTYFVGDTLDTSGLKLTGVLRDGTSVVIGNGFTTQYDFAAAGTKVVSVSFGGFTCTYSVTVKAVEVVAIAPLDYTIADSYYLGDSLDEKFNSIKVTYNNGETTELDWGWSLIHSFDAVGESTVELIFRDFTQTYTVNVLPVNVASLEILSQPNKTEYYAGDAIDLTGLKLRAIYNTGAVETLSSGWTYTGLTDTAGTKVITVEYGGRSVPITIYVAAVVIESISIIALPSQTDYYLDTELNTDGMVIGLNYNNGMVEEITSGWTLDYDFTTAGISEVAVGYSGFTTKFNVTVIEDTLTGLSINTAPEKTTYYLGEALDLTGLTLTARFASGAMAIIGSGWTVEGTIASTGTKTISISYGGRKVTLNVSVLANYITSISIQTLPVKTEYNSSDSLNTAGLTLLATYVSGATTVIEGGWTTEYNFGSEGVCPVTVTFAGCQASFNVNVRFTYTDNTFVFSQDNWSFINTVGAFGGGKYYLTESDYEALTSQLSNTEKSVVASCIEAGWGGSCYGMSVVAMLAKIGIIKPSLLQANATSLYELPRPNDNSIESLINYYQWLQYTKAATQQKIVYAELTDKDKIQDMVRMANAVPTGGYPFLITFQHAGYNDFGDWESWGHAIIGYAVAYGSWSYNGKSYDGRILTYDPNCNGFMSSACIYFNTKTYDWIIPKDNTYRTSGDTSSNGLITLATNNISVVNYAGLCEGNQNYTVDCYTSVLGTQWLEYFELKRVSVSPGPGVYYGASEDEDVTILYDMFADGESSKKMNLVLADSESGYILNVDNKDLLLDMNYEHSLLLLSAKNASEAVFEPSGEISFKGTSSDYCMTMVFDEGYYDFPWYEIKVLGQGVDYATLSKCENGYLLTAQELNNVSVFADGNNSATSLTFSSDYTTVMIVAIDADSFGVYADANGDGVYEKLIKDSDGNTQVIVSDTLRGDVYVDGKVNMKDLTKLAKYVARIETLSDNELANADCYSDGTVNLKDLTRLAKYIAKLIPSLD